MPIGIAKANVEGMRRQADYEERRDALREQRRSVREERQRQGDMGALAFHAKQLEAQQQQPASAGALGKPPTEQAQPQQPQGPQVPSFLDALNEQRVLKVIRENDPSLSGIQRARVSPDGSLIVQDASGVDAIVPAERFAAIWQATQLSGLQPKTYSQKLAAERFALTKEKWEREKDVLDKREARLSKMISPVEKQRLINAKDKLRLLIDQSKNVFDETEQAKLQAKLSVAWDAYTGMMDQFDEQHQVATGGAQAAPTQTGALQATQPVAPAPSPEATKTLSPLEAEKEAKRLRAYRREREKTGALQATQPVAPAPAPEPPPQLEPESAPVGSIQMAGRDVAMKAYQAAMETFVGRWNPATPHSGIRKTFDETWKKTGLPPSEAPHFKQMLDASDKLAKNKAAAPSERSKAKAVVSVMGQQVRKDVEASLSGLDDPDEVLAKWRAKQLTDEEAEQRLLEIEQRAPK